MTYSRKDIREPQTDSLDSNRIQSRLVRRRDSEFGGSLRRNRVVIMGTSNWRPEVTVDGNLQWQSRHPDDLGVSLGCCYHSRPSLLMLKLPSLSS